MFVSGQAANYCKRLRFCQLCAEVAATLSDPGVFEALLNALQDPEMKVKSQSSAALGVYGSRRALAPLCAQGSRYWFVREAFVRIKAFGDQ